MVYFFQAGVPFSSKNAKGTAFSKAFSDNINTNPHISLLKIQDTPSQVPNAPSQVTNTPPKCRRHLVCQPKTASTPTKTASTVNIDLRCFVAMQFLSQIYALFWRTFYRPKNLVAYQKWQIWGMFITLASKLNFKHWKCLVLCRKLFASVMDTACVSDGQTHIFLSNVI